MVVVRWEVGPYGIEVIGGVGSRLWQCVAGAEDGVDKQFSPLSCLDLVGGWRSEAIASCLASMIFTIHDDGP